MTSFSDQGPVAERMVDGVVERGAPMMRFLPTLLVVWGVFMACFLGLLAYNATLARYEEEQLFLTENNPQGKQRQSSIVRQANLTRPLIRVCGVASAALGTAILAMYTWDAWLKIHPR